MNRGLQPAKTWRRRARRLFPISSAPRDLGRPSWLGCASLSVLFEEIIETFEGLFDYDRIQPAVARGLTGAPQND